MPINWGSSAAVTVKMVRTGRLLLVRAWQIRPVAPVLPGTMCLAPPEEPSSRSLPVLATLARAHKHIHQHTRRHDYTRVHARAHAPEHTQLPTNIYTHAQATHTHWGGIEHALQSPVPCVLRCTPQHLCKKWRLEERTGSGGRRLRRREHSFGCCCDGLGLEAPSRTAASTRRRRGRTTTPCCGSRWTPARRTSAGHTNWHAGNSTPARDPRQPPTAVLPPPWLGWPPGCRTHLPPKGPLIC